MKLRRFVALAGLIPITVMSSGMAPGQGENRAWPELGSDGHVCNVSTRNLVPAAHDVARDVERRWGTTSASKGDADNELTWESFYHREPGRAILRDGILARQYRFLRVDWEQEYGVMVFYLEKDGIFYLYHHSDDMHPQGIAGPYVGDPRDELLRVREESPDEQPEFDSSSE